MPARDYCFSRKLIEDTREAFREHYFQDDPSLYDNRDVQKVLNGDWWIMRYLMHKDGSQMEALSLLISSLKWRKSLHLHDIDINYFPEEIYQIGGLFLYENDKCGLPTLYIRLRLIKRIPEISEMLKLFMFYNFFKIDEYTEGKGWGLVIDFSGAGLQNIDFEMAKHFINALKSYFPSGIEYALCVDFPWILKAFYNIVKSWIPANRRYLLKFVSRSTITDYIDKSNLPDFLGGTCLVPYHGLEVIPNGCPNFIDYCQVHLNLNKSTAEIIYKMYLPYLQNYKFY